MQPQPSRNTWFVLGREPLLAAAEITAVLRCAAYTYQPPILITAPTTDAPHLMRQLGGTIKIARERAVSITEQAMKSIIADELKLITNKIHFGLSLYAADAQQYSLGWLRKLGKDSKRMLKQEGLSVRFVENREPALSSVTVEKNHLIGKGREFLIIPAGKQLFSLAITEAVQPFEAFSERDYGRPGRDEISGMLPPKLAMIMINLAQAPKDGVLLDPFCGSGTIISEALLLGYRRLIASDLIEKSVVDTQRNLNWTHERYNIPTSEVAVFQSDVNHISRHVLLNSVDAIVTEPFLGAPLKGNESKETLLKQAAELKTLYIEAFKQFTSILKPNGSVIFIIPRFKFKKEWITIDCKKDIEALGFEAMPLFEKHLYLLYARPDQRVAREIWKFQRGR